MHRHGIPAQAWVVVCDGGKALILQNDGDEKFPNLQVHSSHSIDNAPTHLQGADAPGRVHASTGAARSAVKQTDWHEQAEQTFIREFADGLNKAVTAGTPKAMILIAPPRALGILRNSLSPAALKTVTIELHHDYTHLPTYEIEKRLLAGSDA